MADWRFYGRGLELDQLASILERKRWFFVQITGRRRIGKTALVQTALSLAQSQTVFYVQIPDSGDAGVLSAVCDALDTFQVPDDRFPRPHTLSDLVKLIESMTRDGYVVVLDEFQYFSGRAFTEFCSLLQAAVDRLAAEAKRVRGGLIVLGSIHTEMTALLENRSAPLYNRVTDAFELTHLDIGSVRTILREHTDASPERLLFLWTLFEGCRNSTAIVSSNKSSTPTAVPSCGVSFSRVLHRCAARRRTGSFGNCAVVTTWFSSSWPVIPVNRTAN